MSEEHGPEDAWSQFVQAVFAVNGLINKAGERIARPLGQSAARWHVLGRAFEPQTVARMAADMGHAPQSVQRLADVLEREGLVVYRPHPSDRRTKLVELTPQGLDVLTAIYEQQLIWFEGTVRRLSEPKLRRLTRDLGEVAAVLATSITDHDRTT